MLNLVESIVLSSVKKMDKTSIETDVSRKNYQTKMEKIIYQTNMQFGSILTKEGSFWVAVEKHQLERK
jgi:hypothetical protein